MRMLLRWVALRSIVGQNEEKLRVALAAPGVA
jgi:hypothetical protein